MKEEPIDTAQIDLATLRQKEFPAAQKYRIFIARQAHEAVWEHARQSVNEGREEKGEIVEVGGVLIGEIYKDKEGPFLEIAAAIVAQHTKNEGTQMTFTPETWVHVNQVKAKKYPDARIVGWYHTHPRFGIFLSDMDKFIHQHHFPQPWTTALVVDPVKETEGFFVWNDGEPSPAREYWVGSERRESAKTRRPSPAEPPKRRTEEQPQQESPLAQSLSAVSVAVCFVALLFLFWVVFSREANHSDTEKVVIQVLDAQGNELQNSHDALLVLARQLAAPRKEGDGADAQIQIQLQQVASGLGRASLLNTLAQARLANRQDVIDRIQAEMPGAMPAQKPNNGQATDQQKNPDQNAKPDASKPDSGKQSPATPDTNKQDKPNKAPAEGKKQ